MINIYSNFKCKCRFNQKLSSWLKKWLGLFTFWYISDLQNWWGRFCAGQCQRIANVWSKTSDGGRMTKKKIALQGCSQRCSQLQLVATRVLRHYASIVVKYFRHNWEGSQSQRPTIGRHGTKNSCKFHLSNHIGWQIAFHSTEAFPTANRFPPDPVTLHYEVFMFLPLTESKWRIDFSVRVAKKGLFSQTFVLWFCAISA